MSNHDTYVRYESESILQKTLEAYTVPGTLTIPVPINEGMTTVCNFLLL